MFRLHNLMKSPWFGGCYVTIPKEEQVEFQQLLDELIERRRQRNDCWCEARFSDEPAYQAMKVMKGRKKVRLLFFLAHHDQERLPGYGVQVSALLVNQLLRTRIDFAGDEFLPFFKAACLGTEERRIWCHFGQLVRQIEKHIDKHGLSEKLAADLKIILEKQKRMSGDPARVKRWEAHLRELLDTEVAAETPELEKLLGDGRVGRRLRKDLEALGPERQAAWGRLLRQCQKASAPRPSKKWQQEARQRMEAIGARVCKQQIQDWLEQIARMGIAVDQVRHGPGNHRHCEYIEEASRTLVKGLVWCMGSFHDARTLSLMAELAEQAFQKIPGQGPAAAAVGNAAIWQLAQAPGQKGIAHLTRLRLRIRQASARKFIDGQLARVAEKQGLSTAQLEERAVPDFGLKQGTLEETFGDYQLRLILQRPGKVRLEWRRPDGRLQKSVPASVSKSKPLSARLKALRERAREIRKASSAQRDRVERLYLEEITWTLDEFRARYLDHGLLAPLARTLLWQVEGRPLLFREGRWEDVRGNSLKPAEKTEVRLWHPLHSETETVMAWRARLAELRITQPFKQAWREIYVITPAEAETRVYSNRMAAHILKQHQFSALTAARGWRYSLLGAFDDGRDNEVARRDLPALKLEAQFWIDAPQDYDGEDWNETGIWNHVLTDQLRFIDSQGEPVSLVEVPGLVFSEIMRDLDLFVGVASVGNDPNWRDSGPGERPRWRDYWQEFAFGELGPMAETRKAVLEELLPRLKIHDRTHIEGRFLVVQGKRHQYRIHIGSTNVLIAPENRYLCIVPGNRASATGNLFLPFEGDNGLALVLSKAFLLAEDDKITDKSILSQLS